MVQSVIDLQRHKTAGPTHYRLPPTLGYKGHDVTKERAPAYTMRRRMPMDIKQFVPGPKYTLRPNLTNHGPGDPPAYTLRNRMPLPLKQDVPGPGSYHPERCTDATRRRAPVFSLGNRTMARLMDPLPGPADYRPPPTIGRRVADKPALPAFSLHNRMKLPLNLTGPGPAGYTQPHPDVYLRRAPHPTMHAHITPITNWAFPGPDAYYHQYKWGKHSPAFSLSKRNSPLVMALFLREDNP